MVDSRVNNMDKDKQHVINIIKSVLEEQNQKIAFAYIFGSFTGKYYKTNKSDIDLGIYFKEDQEFYQINDLAYQIQKAIPSHPEIDIVQMQKGDLIINHQIFKVGHLLVDFDHDLHLRFFMQQQSMYMDFKFSRKKLEKGLGRNVLPKSSIS